MSGSSIARARQSRASAYAAWGETCVDHLLGDFAFAIWDSEARRLFCARDHFGVHSFFYAQDQHALVFSNTLNCVRRHPAISDDLDEVDMPTLDWDGDGFDDILNTLSSFFVVYKGNTGAILARTRRDEASSSGARTSRPPTAGGSTAIRSSPTSMASITLPR